MKKLLFITALIVFIACNNRSPLMQDNNEEEYLTSYTNGQGIKFEFNISKSEFDLNETVCGEFIAINTSNDTIIDTIPGGPDHYMIIKDSDLNLINIPLIRTTAFHMITFCPGDTIKQVFTWDQSENTNHTSGYENLKVMTGRYLITYYHLGMNTQKLGKWLYITESGNLFSSNLYWHYDARDSLKLDFIIRNRVNKDKTFVLKSENPVLIEFYDDKNILIQAFRPDIPIDTISLTARSTNRILQCSIAREDSLLKDLTGYLKCKMALYCKSMQFIDSTYLDVF